MTARLLPWMIALAVVPALGASAHDGFHQRFKRANERVAKAPDQPAPYLQRAELYRQHEDWTEALADLARAEALAPELDEFRTIVSGRFPVFNKEDIEVVENLQRNFEISAFEYANFLEFFDDNVQCFQQRVAKACAAP